MSDPKKDFCEGCGCELTDENFNPDNDNFCCDCDPEEDFDDAA